jgi:hypothetical protein
VSKGKIKHSICGIRLARSSEGNILKNVLIIRSRGYESGVDDFLLLAIIACSNLSQTAIALIWKPSIYHSIITNAS